MANSNLTAAKKAKNDEFYTQYRDIEKEINAYLDFNPDVFKGKTVLLPCDYPEWSNFTKFFAQNFQRFGLKKLISTSYAVDSKLYKSGYQVSIFDKSFPHFAKEKTKKNGKIFVLNQYLSEGGKIDFKDLEWNYWEGNGDFSSREARQLYADPYVKNRRGIFEFILVGSVDTKLLYVRVFDEATKKSTYSIQTAEAEKASISNCPLCAFGHDSNKSKILKLAEMDADHVTPWSKGGGTFSIN